DPVRDLDQRHAHQPRAALFDSSREADHCTKGGEVARNVVVGLHGKIARLVERALGRGEAGDVLDDRIEAAPVAPWTLVPVGADVDADDPRPELGQALGREAADGKRSWPIALDKDVSASPEADQRLDPGRLTQVDPGATLAVAGVHQELGL